MKRTMLTILLINTVYLNAMYHCKHARWDFEVLNKQAAALREYRQTHLEPSKAILDAAQKLVVLSDHYLTKKHMILYFSELKSIALQEIKRQEVLINQYSTDIQKEEESLFKRRRELEARWQSFRIDFSGLS